MKRHRPAIATLAFVLAIGACDTEAPSIPYEVAATLPHDPDAYTQGLLFHDRHLFESTGQYGASTLRKVDAESGEVIASVALDSAYFGEGLALVDSTLIQLTWKSGIAFVYDVETLELRGEHRYEGEGWGLCYDGTSLYMSNGSNTLTRRDPATFEVLEEIEVFQDGVSVQELNELECVGELIYANVYLTDRIVQIDKRSGQVVGWIDGFGLAAVGQRPTDPGAVLNGIAYIAETDVLLLAGKLWPRIIALRLLDP